MTGPRVSISVVGICSAVHLARCLEAIEAQEGLDAAPDVVVAHDPHIAGIDDLAPRFPGVRFVCNDDQRTPLELASRALREATGDVILLTEDHCIPRPDWARTLLAAVGEGRAAVGGRVEALPGATSTDWAFYFVDFFRYAAPVAAGPSPTLTVCNAAYERCKLEAVRPLWEVFFHETAIHDALAQRFGSLWLVPASEVAMGRHVRLVDALYERYAFGRLFGCTRLEFRPEKRPFYSLAAVVLPLLLAGRMARKACESRTLARSFVRSFAPLALMVLAWSLGEWLGYLTKRRPASMVVAPEIRAARRAAEGARPELDPEDAAARSSPRASQSGGASSASTSSRS